MSRTKRKNSTKKSKKKIYEKWQTWLVLIWSFIVLLGAIFELPQKFMDTYRMLIPSDNSCFFNGRVIDVNNNPVVNAEVIVQGKKGSGITDINGV